VSVIVSEHKWYILHTQSGKEFVAKEAMDRRVKGDHFDKISDVIVPTYKETVYKDGKKKQVERKSFPGYIYVKMELDRESMTYAQETPYVSQFVVTGTDEPRPLPDKEVKSLIAKTEATNEFSPITIDFDIGQKVLIIDGPFNNFQGTIKAIYPDKRKVAVNVEIFGRTTPVEIDYFKVKKN
jgi:transcriptional antiterminator NusG